MYPPEPGLMSVSHTRVVAGERWFTVPATMMMVSMATLLQSYLRIKLFFVGMFILTLLVSLVVRRTTIVVYSRLLWFYLWTSLGGIAWALVGVLHHANYVQANVEALRLYVIWSVAFVILFTLLRAGPSLRAIHMAVVIAGILIPLINFVGLYDDFIGGGLIPVGIRLELGMLLGFQDGFKITSMNLAAMFIVAPYLLSLQFRSDANRTNSALTKTALIFSLILAVVSGRRALWIVIALTPCAVLLLARLTSSDGLLKVGGRRLLVACATASVIGLGALLMFPESALDGDSVGTIVRVKQAFSSEDERTIQKPYLIDGFLKSPVFGSGFGAYAGYRRNDERPWMYELTYYQLLFNVGIVGVSLLGVLFALYFVAVVRLLRQFKEESAIPFGLLIGICSLLLGAYSNPYLGGFDSLFFVGLLPFLSTFQRGFEWQNRKRFKIESAA